MAYGCEILFTVERAAAVRELIEGAMGELCPCKQGRGCPLIPVIIVDPPEREQLPIVAVA
jgi:hypothetical protein